NDCGFHEVKDEKDEGLLHPDDLEYFHQTYNVTGLRPVFVDHSGYAMLILDNRGSMFIWDEMARNFDYLGNSLREVHR
ncbi:8759_t:CDS:2, partial [Racocetra fulgida]